MSIPSQMSLVGFVASAPERTFVVKLDVEGSETAAMNATPRTPT